MVPRYDLVACLPAHYWFFLFKTKRLLLFFFCSLAFQWGEIVQGGSYVTGTFHRCVFTILGLFSAGTDQECASVRGSPLVRTGNAILSHWCIIGLLETTCKAVRNSPEVQKRLLFRFGGMKATVRHFALTSWFKRKCVNIRTQMMTLKQYYRDFKVEWCTLKSIIYSFFR